MTVPAAERAAIAARQVKLTTGGHTDHTRCYVQLADFWRSSADMCQGEATHRVCVDNYSTGVTTQGVFHPATTETRVCAHHEAQVRKAPGYRWSHELARVIAVAEPAAEDLTVRLDAVLFATLVPDMPIKTAAVLAARLDQAGYRLVHTTDSPADHPAGGGR